VAQSVTIQSLIPRASPHSGNSVVLLFVGQWEAD
jgi:hypothetical protein